MNRIEFIGTSYVGKSTLYNALSKQIKNSENYITEQSCRHIARKKIGPVRFLFRKCLEKGINILGGKYDVYNIPKLNLLQATVMEQYKNSLEICFNKDIVLIRGIAFSNKIYLLLLHMIAKYEFYENTTPKKTIIVEESIIHWHLIYQELVKNQLVEFKKLNVRDIGLFPKAIIICYADPDTILKRMKLREADRKLNKNHFNMEHSVILEEVLLRQEIYMQHAKNAQSINIDVLYINTAEELQYNLKIIQDFLETVNCSNPKLHLETSLEVDTRVVVDAKPEVDSRVLVNSRLDLLPSI